MLLEIIQQPNPILKEEAAKIAKLTPEIKTLAKNMLDTMYNFNGVGLAAPQVAHSLQLIVIDETPERNSPKVFINPEIVSHGRSCVEAVEGCLSCRGQERSVERYYAVTVKAKDLSWKNITIKAEGLLARVLQHEIDHLHGVTIVDIGKPVPVEEPGPQENFL